MSDEFVQACTELQKAQNAYTNALVEHAKSKFKLEEKEYYHLCEVDPKELGSNEKQRRAKLAQLCATERNEEYVASLIVIKARGIFQNASRYFELEKTLKEAEGE